MTNIFNNLPTVITDYENDHDFNTTSTPNTNISRIRYEDWGYQEAGKTNGSPEALRNCLVEIKEGQALIAAAERKQYDDNRVAIQKAIIKRKAAIDLNQQEIEAINAARGRKLQDLERIVQQHERRIADLEANKGIFLDEAQQPFPYLRYVTLGGIIALAMWLVFFYHSTLFIAFGSMVSSENIMEAGGAAILANVIQPLSIKLASGYQWALTAGALCLFLGLAVFVEILPHMIKTKYIPEQTLRLLPYGLIFILDFLLACFVEASIADARHNYAEKTNSPEVSLTEFSTYRDFGIVLIFGFVANVAFGFTFSYYVKLLKKERNIDQVRAKEKYNRQEAIKQEIEAVQQQKFATFEDFQQQADEKARAITLLNRKIENLQHEYNKPYDGPPHLRHIIQIFCRGWIRYVSGLDNQKLKEIEQIRDTFLTNLTTLNHA